MITNEHIRGASLRWGLSRHKAREFLLSHPTEEEIQDLLRVANGKHYTREVAEKKAKWFRLSLAIITYRSHYQVPSTT